MKIHTNRFKEEVKKLGKQIDSKITYELDGVTVELGSEDLNSITPHYEANILKSVMKELEIDSNFEIPIGTEINYQFGVFVDDSYEYLDFGNYIVNKCEKKEDTNSWEIKCYDKMLYSMVDYEDLGVSYPITIRNYLSAICNKLGLTFASASDNFVNYNQEIPNELYFDEEGKKLGYTFRDVLDDLAEVTASTIVINNDDELEVRYINDTQDTIDEEYLKDVNVKFGEKYGAVNTVILSRSAGADKISQSIPENLPDEQKVPVIIEDNLIMNDNDRSRFIPAILNKLNGLEYYLNDFSSTGITYYDVCDKYNVKVGNTTYSCIMFNDEMLVTQGLQENVHTDMPEYGEVDYKKTDKTDQKINQTNLIVDKHGRQITAIIQDQTETNSRLNATISTLDGTIQRVSRTETSIIDITTTTQVSTGKNHLYTDDAVEGNALSYSVDGATEQQTYTGKNLCGVPDQTFTHNNVTVTIKDGEITLNGTANATGTKWIDPIKTTTINGNYVNNCIYISGTAPSTNPANFNVRKSDGTIIQGTQVNLVDGSRNAKFSVSEDTSIIYGIYVQNSTTYTNYKFKPQLVTGTSEDYNWEKYVGGTVSPNPDYPQEVKTIPGIVNLCESTYINPTLTQYSTVLFIEGDLKPSTTYTLSFKGVANNGLYTNENLFNQVVFTVNSGITSVTVTTKSSISKTTDSQYENGKGWKILKNRSGGVSTANTFENVMFEEGSTAHEYIPYGYYTRVKVTGKNILTIKDITNIGSLVNNGDGSITINGGFSSTSWTLSNPIILKANTTYILSLTNTYENAGASAFILRHGSTNIVSLLLTNNSISYTPTQDVIIDTLRMYNAGITYNNYTFSIQLEQGLTTTTYEPYKENQVLIDMSKPSIFNIVNTPFTSRVAYNSSGVQQDWNGYSGTTDFTPINSNTIYSVNTNLNPYTTYIVEYDSTQTFIQRTSLTNYGRTFTTQSTTKYIKVSISDETVPTTFEIYQSNNNTPYYELCKIGDYKDNLFIDASGNCRITKNIGKVVLNGGESWSTNTSLSGGRSQFYITFTNGIGVSPLYSDYFLKYDVAGYDNGIYINNAGNLLVVTSPSYNGSYIVGTSNWKTWLSTHNTDVYYVLATPETINLSNTKIPLFQGINHIYLVDDLETDTSISFYRQTPLTGTYATVTQLNEVSTEKTQQITQVRKDMLVDLNSERLRIDAVNQIIQDGVPILDTGTGYVFDSDGLKIEKTNQDVKSQLDNDGLSVIYNDNDVLTARSDGVNAVNMTVNKFYVQKPIRMEKTKSITDGSSVGLGFFYVGE